MISTRTLTVAAVVTIALSSSVCAQTQRVRGTLEKVEGNTLTVKPKEGASLTLKLTDKAQIVAVVKASLADIKPGDYIGSGAVPQADGSQKAVEVHIFAAVQRGTGDGHRTGWPGAANGTMTNGEVGDAVINVDGGVLTVKYKGGEKKIIVTPGIRIVRYVITDRSELKPGATISVTNALKKPDGTFEVARINVGRDIAP